MTSDLADNLLWLRRHFPHLYDTVRGRTADVNAIRAAQTRSGQANLEMKRGDVWVPLYSQYSPEREVTRWAETLMLQENSVLLLFGCGLGYHLQAVFKCYPEVRVHLYEPSLNIFLKALEIVDFTRWPKERILSWVVAEDRDIIEGNTFEPHINQGAFFEQVKNHSFDRQPVLEMLPAYNQLFAEEKKTFFQRFKEYIVSTRFNLNTTRSHERRWTLNALLNFPYTLQSPNVDVLKPLMAGKPLVIVSSGPSLEREINHLKEIRDHVVMLAAGSSVNGLLHHGVEPHAVLSFDPAEANKKVFDLMADYGVDIPFIFGTTLYHEILSTYHFPALALYHMIISQDRVTPYVFRRIHHREAVFSDAPSVAILALQLAYHLKAHPIILVGQDLAFPGKKFYSSGVSHYRDQELTDEEMRRYFEVEQVGEGKVLTSHSLNEMRKNMERWLHQYQQLNPELTVINTSREGAKIAHTVEMPLETVIAQYVDRNDMIENPFVQGVKQYQHPYDQEKAKQVYDQLLASHEALKKKFSDLAQTVEKLAGGQRAQTKEKLFRDIGRKVNKITKDQLFSTIFLPMLQTQLEAYVRTAKQTMSQPLSDESVQKMVERDQAFVAEFTECYELLREKGVFK